MIGLQPRVVDYRVGCWRAGQIGTLTMMVRLTENDKLLVPSAGRQGVTNNDSY